MSEKIPFSRLSGVHRITGDYIDGRQAINSLLGGDWRDKATRQLVRDSRRKTNRNAGLAAAITESYNGYEIPPEVQRNIEALDHPDTLAIVTGQQVGLFGGPLYTYYKALTAVLMAKELSQETDGKVVPVFWMETADADFSEVDHVGFPPNHPKYPVSRRSVYLPTDIIAGRSTRWHKFSDEIEKAKSQLLEWLHPLPYKKKIVKVLHNAYKPGFPIADAFRELMTELMGSMGLVMFDPLAPSIVERSKDFWVSCLDRPERFSNAFSVTSREITSLRLPLQVKLRDDTLPVFWIDNEGMRHRIIGTPGTWHLQSEEHVYKNGDLCEKALGNGGMFSPSALLRPLLQDWLLPTWMYIGGPSEIAYHAQIGRAYDQINLPRPLIAPRISATIVELYSRRILDRNNWKVSEVFGGKELLLRTRGMAGNLAELFDNGEIQLRGWLERVRQGSDDAGVNIIPETDTIERKILYQWDKLRTISARKITLRDETRVEQARKLQDRLMPDNMPQERHNSALFFLARYGDKFLHAINAEKDLFNPFHFVVDLEERP